MTDINNKNNEKILIYIMNIIKDNKKPVSQFQNFTQ